MEQRNIVMKRFVRSVNGALISHSMETLDELRIKSGLDNNNAEDIDRWIELALRKKVQKLELKFNANTHDARWNIFRYQSCDYSPYVFPNVERFDVPPHGLSLVSISLSHVYLSTEILESLMINCPNLKDLRIERTKGLESLGPSCYAARLRRLSVVDCTNLSKIEICAPNLVSYELLPDFYKIVTTKLHGVSSLVHLSLGGCTYNDLFFNLFHDVRGCVSRLETLKLQISEVVPRSMLGYRIEDYERMEFKFPNLPRLRRLVLEIDTNEEDSILCFTPLVNAAPSLEEIVLRLMGRGAGSSRKPEPAEKGVGEKHECVKVLEIDNYLGKAVDVEMILYVMDHAPSLEKVMIDDVAYTGQDLHLLKGNLMEEL